jgi:wobble nucleotide-excising tRNase
VPLTNQAAPCFKNALSAGDRNTLGLAFFFAALENEPDLNNSIILLDDPISSLDDGRTVTTIEKIRNLSVRSKQVIVLCHLRGFLCDIWEHSNKDTTTTLKIARGPNNTSNITLWEASSDALTEYDKRHKALRDYTETDTQDKRYIAQCLRPVMEKYLRITFPEHCTPGTLLGTFKKRIENLFRKGIRVMSDLDMRELGAITDYANKFHHDTNPAWETEQINDAQLLTFVKRVLNFVSHGTK